MASSIDSPEGTDWDDSHLGNEISERQYDRLMNYPENLDFYSLLALPRKPPPTDAQIRSAYHTLTLSFHPDKQPPNLRDAATNYFGRIRTAYETLIDPKKRAVYDMLGEEGVRAEWEAGGAMGIQGEAEKQQVGVKAMDAGQFRRWFLTTMKQRERKELEHMVEAKGLVQLRVDARSMFRDPDSPAAPILKPTSFSLGLNFKTPFSLLKWFQDTHHYDAPDESVEEKAQSETKPEGYDDEDMELEFHAAVGGSFKSMTQTVTFESPTTGQDETRTIGLPPALLASSISLGATLGHTVRGAGQGDNRAILNRFLFPVLGDSVVRFTALALPEPSVQATVNKVITPVKHTFPVNLALQTTFSKSPLSSPPALSAGMSRHLGTRSLIYSNWSSGTLSWPRFVETLFSSTKEPEDEIASLVLGQASNFELGFYSLPEKRAKDQLNTDPDDEDPSSVDNSEAPVKEGVASEPREVWGLNAQTSPVDLQLSVNYSRNLFTSTVDEPKLSEWNLEGHYPNKGAGSDRSVRLQVSTAVRGDLSLSWTVTGTRKVGDFTRIGLGVGIEDGTGLVVSLTWRRLGQTIKLPIALCPLEYAKEVGPLAVIVPWLAYSAIEFGYLRPRERRKKQQSVAKQRKRLKRLVDKRRTESLEAIDLMSEQVKRRQAREAAKDGLVILHAEFGHAAPRSNWISQDSEQENSSKLADVTIPVAALVDQSQLIIPNNVVKSHIPGFYDPAPLLPKVLKVRYRFSGKEHVVEVDDSDGLTCPMRSHMP